ncbi:hypothetical protein [Thaumasiovibrio subtropicus]|uniref:hypothetical protein n=1 Tax=Thaumasiovibrio subtropicus TaxID=1891207 RepID=UPI000B351A97|nr:hypothetical protein [Thaumasiovibrio subtropicus]
MIEIEFSIWLASKLNWVHLVKKIHMPCVPRVGEYMKFRNKEEGDYFGWKVTEVTYRESGSIEVWTELLDNIDDRMYSFEEDEEFQECYKSYLAEGWTSPHGIKVNTRYQNRTSG